MSCFGCCCNNDDDDLDFEEALTEEQEAARRAERLAASQARREEAERNKRVSETGDLVYTKYSKDPTASILSATPERLVQCTYDPHFANDTFITRFVNTYRAFMSPEELVAVLIEDYELEEHDVDKKLNIIKVFSSWITTDFDFRHDDPLIEDVLSFLDKATHEADNPALEDAVYNVARLVIHTVDDERKGRDLRRDVHQASIMAIGGLTESMGVANMDPSKFKVKRLAQEITLITHSLFSRIEPVECLHQVFSKSPENAPNFTAVTEWSNRLRAWVVSALLTEQSLSNRVKLWSKFVAVAKEMLRMGNFHDSMGITITLTATIALLRLKTMLDDIPGKTTSTLESLETLFSYERSYKRYRARLEAAQPPGIPAVNVLEKDLFLIDEGNDDWKPNHHINFVKLEMMGTVISVIERFQGVDYAYTSDDSLRTYLLHGAMIIGEGEHQQHWLDIAEELEATDAD